MEGEFIVEAWTSDGVTKKAEYVSTIPSFTYDNADLVADFDSSEPSAIMIKLKNVEAGYASDVVSLVINKK